jgi:phage-related minor tail protein
MAGDFAVTAATGAVMTAFGPASLTKYAKGGIANRPQISLFGEGSTPEAYVPLPDGRSIPVTMTGMGNTTNNSQGGVYISINVANGSDNTSTQGDDAETWKRVAQRVKGVVLEELVTQQRPGGVLSR